MSGQISDMEKTDRTWRNRRKYRRTTLLAMETLDQRVMLTGVPSDVVSIGRTPSAWTADEVGDGTFRIRYAVYNDQNQRLEDVRVSTTLATGVEFVGTVGSATQAGKSVQWVLPAIEPYGRAEVELTVRRTDLQNFAVDTGAVVTGVVSGTTVTDSALPLALRPGPITAGSLNPTQDADSADPFIMAKAAELDQDPARIFEFLSSQIGFESYAGSLRGARGTLWAGAGNAIDVSSLGVALLRASGVPAVYAQGAISDVQAGALIASMFTDPTHATGFIPAGTTVSDPVHDAKLLGETRDHFWIRFDAGAGLTDIDALMPGATPGQTLATALGTFAEVPDAMRHKVTIRIDRETANTAVSGLFGMDPRQIDTALQVTFSAAHLVGRPLSFGNFVSSSTISALAFTSTTNTYSPYLAEGDLAYPLTHDHVIRGSDFQETLTNFPFGSVILTGLFLSIEMQSPDGTTETLDRTLFDRIGYDVRMNGGTPNLNIQPGTTAVSDLDITTIDFSTGLQPYSATYALRSEVESLQALVQAMAGADGSVPADSSDELRLFAMGVSRLMVADYLTISGYDRTALAERLFVKSYADQPIVQLASTRLVAEDGVGRIVNSLDLRNTEMRAIAYPGQSLGVLPVYQILRGMRESGIETEVVTRNSPSSQSAGVVSTVRVFEAASEAGIDTLVLDANQAGLLDTLDYSGEAQARILHALAGGLVVIVPSRNVVIDGQPTIAWYEVEPQTGRTIGVTSDGGHQAISEFVGRIMMSILEDLALGAVVAAWDVIFHPDILNDPDKLKEYANGILNPMTLVTAGKEGLVAGMTPRWRMATAVGLIAVVVSNMLQGLAVGALLNQVDPPAPDFLISLDPLPELSDLPETSAEIGVGVAKDPLLVLPVGGALLPTVFRVGIRNFADTGRTFRLTDLVAPAGFEIVTSLAEVTVPAGQTAEIGLALKPIGSIPAPGTNATFSFRVEDVADPGNSAAFEQPFVVPAFGSLVAEVIYDSAGVLPGQATAAKVILRSVGNMGVNVDFTLLAPDGLAVEGLTSVALAAGEVLELPLTLTAAPETPLNSSLTASIRADFGGEEPVWVNIPVSVVAPGAQAAVNAAKAAADLGKPALSPRLDDLSIALTKLASNTDDPVARDQAVNAIDSVLSQMRADAVLSAFVPALDAARNSLATAAGPDASRDAILAVGAALDNFGTGVEALSRGDFQVYMLPNQREARPNQPEKFEIVVQNVGTESTVYRIGLPQLPSGVTASLSAETLTLAPGQVGSVFLTMTQTSLTELLTFGFTVPVTLDVVPEIGRGVAGSFVARQEFVSVVDVSVTPPFGASGAQVAVSTRILNAVNTKRDVLVSYVLKNAAGTVVRTGAPVAATLDVLTSITTVDLGVIDTAGLPDGTYRVEVSVTETAGSEIPGGMGSTSLLIGSPVTATITTDRTIVPTGAQTVTSTLKIDATIGFDSPFTLKSQTSVPGAAGVVAQGNYVYVGGNDGLRIYDVTDPASPQLVRTFGAIADILEIRGDKLYALRRGGFDGQMGLYIYSLAEPANPQLLGTTPGIPYANAWHMAVTDTHVFLTVWSFAFWLGINDIQYQTGDVLSINVSNPAAPFVENVLRNTYGTNVDGIGMLGNVDNNGGDGNTWQAAVASPGILLVAGSTAAGDNTRTGQGVVHVVDISDPAHLRIVRSIVLPGTVAAVGLAVEGNRALVTASTAGWADQTSNLDLLGNMVIATLDLTDPATPSLIHSETLTRPSAGPWSQFLSSLGNGLFALTTPGTQATDPALLVIDITDPARPVIGKSAAPSGHLGLAESGSYVFTTSGDGLMAYQVGAPTAIPATVSVPVPKGSATVIPGSFSLTPTRVIDGPDAVTYEWDLAFSSAQSTRTITWQTLITGLQPGSSVPVNLEGAVSFVSQGTGGEIDLPRTNVATEQILSIDPSSELIRRGESAQFSVTVRNVTGIDAYYDLSVLGVPEDWVDMPAFVFVPAGGFAFAELKVTPGFFTTDALYRIVVKTTSGDISGMVGALLTVHDQAAPPVADTQARGVLASVDPGTVTVGPGTSGLFTLRVTNTGSETDTFALSAIGVPGGILLEWLQPEVTVAPGRFVEVPFRVTGQTGVQPGALGLTIDARSTTLADISAQAAVAIDVAAQGVLVDLNPATGTDGASYFATIRNTGSHVDTFLLTLGGPAGMFARLETTSVTLAPGTSTQVRVDVDSLGHAIPGAFDLVVYAESQADSQIRGGDSARIILRSNEGVTASFEVDRISRTDAGLSRFMLHVVNSGNRESTYRAILETSAGPVIVSILGFDGVSPLGNSTFRLPPKSETWIPVYLDLLQLGTGTATIRVVSSIDDSVAAQATATLEASDGLVDTTTTLTLPADGWPRSQPVPLQVVVSAADTTMPAGFVTFVIDGVASQPVHLVLSNGKMIALASFALSPGSHSIRAEFTPASGYRTSSSTQRSLVVAADPVTDEPGPQVTAVVRYGYHAQPTSFVVTFDSAMDPAKAADLSNYVLIGAGRDGRFGTRDDQAIRLKSAAYDAATHKATLTPANRLLLRARYQLALKGSTGGLTDVSGRSLDGDSNGKAGGDFVRMIDQRDLAGPAPNFRRMAASKLAPRKFR